MLDGKPPESGEPPARGAERLSAARGEFREGLGALKNLTQLLQSSKAGPKALASLLPDVHASCRTLQRATAVLLDAFGERIPPESDAVATLRRFAEPRLLELETTLERSLNQPINAKNRLTLEQVVTRIVRDLEGARADRRDGSRRRRAGARCIPPALFAFGRGACALGQCA